MTKVLQLFCLQLAVLVTLLAKEGESSLRRIPLSRILGEVAGSEVRNGPIASYIRAEGQPGRITGDDRIWAGLDDVESLKYDLTTFSSPANSVIRGHSCMPAFFFAFDYLFNEYIGKTHDPPASTEQFDITLRDSMIIFLDKISVEKRGLGVALSKFLQHGWTLGFLKNHSVVPELRLLLTRYRIPFFENLQLPRSFKPTANVRYHAFSYVFTPFKNGTSLVEKREVIANSAPVFTLLRYPQGTRLPLDSLLNLASLDLWDNTDAYFNPKFNQYCSTQRTSVKMLNHRLADDSYPMPKGVDRPHFAKREDSSERWLRFSGRTGTHVVAPYHFDQTKPKPRFLSKPFGPCVRVNISLSSRSVTAKDLTGYESVAGQIPEGSIVLIDTGFGAEAWSDPERYEAEFPTLAVDAANLLVARGISAVGFDGPSLDTGEEMKYPAHGIMAQSNIPVMLNVKIGDDSFPQRETGAYCTLSYLRSTDMTSSPASIFALMNYEKFEPTQRRHRVRWQLGAVIRPNEDIEIKSKDLAASLNADKLPASEVALTVDPVKNKITTFTAPVTHQLVTSSMVGCIPTYLIKSNDPSTIVQFLKKTPAESQVLLMHKDLTPIGDNDELVKVAAGMNIVLGFFADSKLPQNLQGKLTKYSVSFFENLQPPSKDFLDAEASADKIYYAFRFIFAAPIDETSVERSLSMDPPRKINLADLVIFGDEAGEVNFRCSKRQATSEVRILSQWPGPADRVAAFPGVEVPQLASDSGKLMFSDHYSTHLLAPVANGSYDRILNYYYPYVPFVKIKIPIGKVLNYSISKFDLEKYEQETGTNIEKRSFVLIDTGFAYKWLLPSVYSVGYPGLSVEAAKFLIDQKQAIGIGIDSMAIDDFSLTSKGLFPTGRYVAGEGRPVIVNIGRDLDYAPGVGGVLVMSSLRIEGAPASPLALFGLPDPPTSRTINLMDADAVRESANKADLSHAAWALALLGAVGAALARR